MSVQAELAATYKRAHNNLTNGVSQKPLEPKPQPKPQPMPALRAKDIVDKPEPVVIPIIASPESELVDYLKIHHFTEYQARHVVRAFSMFVRLFIDPTVERPKRLLRLSTIIKVVCDGEGVDENDVISNRREYRITQIRHVIALMCKEFSKASFPTIGRMMGDRDHTTIIHGVRRAKELEAQSPEFKAKLEGYRQHLRRLVDSGGYGFKTPSDWKF